MWVPFSWVLVEHQAEERRLLTPPCRREGRVCPLGSWRTGRWSSLPTCWSPPCCWGPPGSWGVCVGAAVILYSVVGEREDASVIGLSETRVGHPVLHQEREAVVQDRHSLKLERGGQGGGCQAGEEQ